MQLKDLPRPKKQRQAVEHEVIYGTEEVVESQPKEGITIGGIAATATGAVCQSQGDGCAAGTDVATQTQKNTGDDEVSIKPTHP